MIETITHHRVQKVKLKKTLSNYPKEVVKSLLVLISKRRGLWMWKDPKFSAHWKLKINIKGKTYKLFRARGNFPVRSSEKQNSLLEAELVPEGKHCPTRDVHNGPTRFPGERVSEKQRAPSRALRRAQLEPITLWQDHHFHASSTPSIFTPVLQASFVRLTQLASFRKRKPQLTKFPLPDWPIDKH